MTSTVLVTYTGKEEPYLHLKHVDVFFQLSHFVGDFQHNSFGGLFLL